MILCDRDGVQKCVVPENALVYKSERYRLYRALSLDEKQSYLLRIPCDVALNGEVNSEAETLKLLKEKSDDLEKKKALVTDGPVERIHYDWLFPRLVDTFVLGEDQGYRQANLLSILDGDVADFYPLPKLKNSYFVDAKSAAWILGRFFKLQTFLDDIGVYYKFDPNQVLIEPKYHRVVYIDWTHTSDIDHYNNGKLMAKTMLDWLKDNDTEREADFRKLLTDIAEMPDDNVLEGMSLHRLLYGNIRVWWGREYYPFTYFVTASHEWRRVSDSL